MDPGTWAWSCDLFERAVALDAHERTTFLEEACGRDREVLSLVERMIDADGAQLNVVDRMNAVLGTVRPTGLFDRLTES